MRLALIIFVFAIFLSPTPNMLIGETHLAQANARQQFQGCMSRCRSQEAKCYQGKSRGICSRQHKSCVLRCERYLSRGKQTLKPKSHRRGYPNR
ncbi:MAG: hypothetical protein AAF228_03905 [Pseudomonadota bacterium]